MELLLMVIITHALLQGSFDKILGSCRQSIAIFAWIAIKLGFACS